MKATDIQIKPADYVAVTAAELTKATMEWTNMLENKLHSPYEANKNILLRRNIHELCIECERQNLNITEVLKLLKRNRTLGKQKSLF